MSGWDDESKTAPSASKISNVNAKAIKSSFIHFHSLMAVRSLVQFHLLSPCLPPLIFASFEIDDDVILLYSNSFLPLHLVCFMRLKLINHRNVINKSLISSLFILFGVDFARLARISIVVVTHIVVICWGRREAKYDEETKKKLQFHVFAPSYTKKLVSAHFQSN